VIGRRAISFPFYLNLYDWTVLMLSRTPSKYTYYLRLTKQSILNIPRFYNFSFY
jgi:hypothetical protein